MANFFMRLFGARIRDFRTNVFGLLKIEGTKKVVEGVDKARKGVSLLLWMFFFLVLGSSGVILLCIGLVEAVPLEAATRGWILFGLGCFMLLVAVTLVLVATSEKLWIRALNVNDWISSAVNEPTGQIRS